MDIDANRLIIDKYIVDYVYNAAQIEGLNTKYLDTKFLVEDDIIPQNIDANKVIILKNLKDAYKALKEEDFANMFIDINAMNRVNVIINGRGLVKEAGRIRKDPVYVDNSSYIPEIPDPYIINETILKIINESDDYLLNAIKLYLYIMRAQPYIDGNKRTANVFANIYLLQHEPMLISIHANKKYQFFVKLSKFYETNDYEPLIKFIKEYGIYTFHR